MTALSMSVSTSYELNFLIITANVGTLFENVSITDLSPSVIIA